MINYPQYCIQLLAKICAFGQLHVHARTFRVELLFHDSIRLLAPHGSFLLTIGKIPFKFLAQGAEIKHYPCQFMSI